MKRFYLFAFLLFSYLGAALSGAAQTQLDPSFTPPSLRQPAGLEQALQLSDGSRILVGGVNYVNGTAGAVGCIRFTAAGSVDTGFQTQTAAFSAQVLVVAEAAGNKLLVVIKDSVLLGGQYRKGLIRLFADGSYDAAFTSLPQSVYGLNILDGGGVMAVQPDGCIVLGGGLATAAQPASATALPVVRLLANGQPDSGFNTLIRPIFTGTGLSAIYTIRVQADGRILLGGRFYANSGRPSVNLLRVLNTGASDASFVGPVGYNDVKTLALQPDGKILVAYRSYDYAPQTLLTRLLANGAIDASFTAPALVVSGEYYANNTVVQVQADGRILVAGAAERDFSVFKLPQGRMPTQFITRLLANGQLDSSWQPPVAGNDNQAAVQSLQLLPNGQILVGGAPRVYGAATAVPIAVGVLDNTGQYLSGFAPLLQVPGRAGALATQADGKILVAGAFTEINGQPARNLARLLPTGTVDAAFTANAQVTGGNQFVAQVAVQPNGSVLIAGDFARVAGQPRPCVARLLATGVADAGFVPALAATSAAQANFAAYMVLQADGKVLVSGHLRPTGSSQQQVLARLTTTGAADASFQPPAPVYLSGDVPIAVQANGNIVTANVGFRAPSLGLEDVTQLLPSGALDPAYLNQATTNFNSPAYIWDINLYPDGRVLLNGYFFSFSNKASNYLVRLLPSGAIDATFTSLVNAITPYCVALQPNGRILAGGYSRYNPASPTDIGLARLLPDGSRDASLVRVVSPITEAFVGALKIQADGGILASGDFTLSTPGQEPVQLIRLLDANVLHVASSQVQANTSAYPVPAHDQLCLRLDGAAHPQTVLLLDALGRPVLRQAVLQPEMQLATGALAPGLYLLRVQYATGTVTRRVVLE